MADLPKRMRIAKPSFFRIDPMEIDIDEERLNGRMEPLADDYIRSLAVSIIDKTQLQPVRIRHTHGSGEDRQFTVVLGFQRAKAVRLINTDPDLRQRAKLGDGDVFPLTCILSDVNEEEAFVQNITENAQRRNTSPMEDAINQARLREMGKTPEEIADIYGCSTSRISQLKGLLILSEQHRMMVHRGEVSVSAALQLTDIAPGERDEVIAETGGSTVAIKDKVRANGKRVARPLSQVRKWLSEAKQGTYQSEHTVTVLEAFEAYVSGEIDEDGLLERIDQ